MYPGRPSSHDVRAEFVGSSDTGRRLDPQVVEFIVSEYRAGRSLREVAEMTGRSHGAVRNILDRAGVPRRVRGAPRLQKD